MLIDPEQKLIAAAEEATIPIYTKVRAETLAALMEKVKVVVEARTGRP